MSMSVAKGVFTTKQRTPKTSDPNTSIDRSRQEVSQDTKVRIHVCPHCIGDDRLGNTSTGVHQLACCMVPDLTGGTIVVLKGINGTVNTRGIIAPLGYPRCAVTPLNPAQTFSIWRVTHAFAGNQMLVVLTNTLQEAKHGP